MKRLRLAEKQGHQIRAKLSSARAAARGKMMPRLSRSPLAGYLATAAAGEQPCLPPPHHQARSGGRRRLADARHGVAVARSGRPSSHPTGAFIESDWCPTALAWDEGNQDPMAVQQPRSSEQSRIEAKGLAAADPHPGHVWVAWIEQDVAVHRDDD